MAAKWRYNGITSGQSTGQGPRLLLTTEAGATREVELDLEQLALIAAAASRVLVVELRYKEQLRTALAKRTDQAIERLASGRSEGALGGPR